MGILANNSVDSRWTYYLSCAKASNLAEKSAVGNNLTYFDGSANFNGTSSYIQLPTTTSLLKVSTIRLIIDYKTKFHCFLSNGITITITGTTLNVFVLTSPLVYVNGKVVSNTLGNISTGINDIIITTTTKFSLLSATIGKNSTNFSDGSIKLFSASPYTFTKDEVELLYNNSLYKPLQLPTPKNNLPCCFQGNGSAYLESPVDSKLSFTDGVNDKPFWVYLNTYINDINTQFAYSILYKVNEYTIYTNTSYLKILLFDTSTANIIGYDFLGIVDKLIGSNNKLLIIYDGTIKVNENNSFKFYLNNLLLIPTSFITTITGTYNCMKNTNSILYLGRGLSGYIISNNKLFNIKIGTGNLTSQNITDLFNYQNIGSEIAHWPLSESGGNIRYDVIGTNHLVLKGTTDGNYNVGYQNVWDWNSIVGGCTKINYWNGGGAYVNVIKSLWYCGTEFNQTTYIQNTPIFSYSFRCIIPSIVSGMFDRLFASFGASFLSETYSSIYWGSSTLIYQTYPNQQAFNGTNNSINTPSSLYSDGKSHHFCVVGNGTNIYIYIDGVSIGYVTPPVYQTPNLQIIRGLWHGNNTQIGIFYDFKFWNNVALTSQNALDDYNNVNSNIPTHAYSLLGENPGKDLVGTLDLIKGINYPEYTIPNKLNNTSVLTTYQPITPSNPTVIKRNQIKEIFNLGVKGGQIVEKYGTVYSNINSVQVVKDVQPAMNFNGTNYLDMGNILNTEMKDGFIILCWHKQLGNFNRGTNDLGLISKYISPFGFYTVDDYTLFHNVAKTPTVTSKGLKNSPCLSVFMVYKEKTHIYGFTDDLRFKTTIETNFFIQDLTQNLLIGRGLSTATKPNYVGLIYNTRILSGGVLNQQEAYQIWANEKSNYGI